MTDEGHPWVSLVVHKTRLKIAQDPSLNYEYLPLLGMKSFIQAALELLFGKHSQAIAEKRVRHREKTDPGLCGISGASTLTKAVFPRLRASIAFAWGSRAGIQTYFLIQTLSCTHSRC